MKWLPFYKGTGIRLVRTCKIARVESGSGAIKARGGSIGDFMAHPFHLVPIPRQTAPTISAPAIYPLLTTVLETVSVGVSHVTKSGFIRLHIHNSITVNPVILKVPHERF